MSELLKCDSMKNCKFTYRFAKVFRFLVITVKQVLIPVLNKSFVNLVLILFYNRNIILIASFVVFILRLSGKQTHSGGLYGVGGGGNYTGGIRCSIRGGGRGGGGNHLQLLNMNQFCFRTGVSYL